MKSIRIRRPSASLIISILALVLATTGIATGLPGKNKVDSGDIRTSR